VKKEIELFFKKLDDDLFMLDEFSELMEDEEISSDFYKVIIEKSIKTKLEFIDLLKSYDNKKIVDYIIRWLENEKDVQIIASLISLLGKYEFENKLNILKPFLKSEERRIRANVIEAIGKNRLTEEISQILIPFLKDPDNRVRANAAMVLWNNENLRDKVKQAFSTMIENNDKWMNASAIYAFGELGIEDFILYLLEHLKDEDEDICRNALIALIGFADKSTNKEK